MRRFESCRPSQPVELHREAFGVVAVVVVPLTDDIPIRGGATASKPAPNAAYGNERLKKSRSAASLL
jgi:hypothetical protein